MEQLVFLAYPIRRPLGALLRSPDVLPPRPHLPYDVRVEGPDGDEREEIGEGEGIGDEEAVGEQAGLLEKKRFLGTLAISTGCL